MISFSKMIELYLRALWTYSAARCGFLTLKPDSITYQKLNGCYLVQIALRLPKSDELISFSGIGTLRVGFAKAFSELLEALSAQKLSINWETGRSGFACAATKAEAQIRAYTELIERDAFLMHFFCPDLTSKPQATVTIDAEDIRSVSLQSSDNSIAVSLAAIFKTDHIFLGLGTGANPGVAVAKARDEVLMLSKTFHAFTVSGGSKAAGLAQHFEASMLVEVHQRVERIMSGGGNARNNLATDLSKSKIELVEFFASDRVVVRCSHRQLLPLTFGNKWFSSKVDLESIFAQRELAPLPFIRHPFL